jgi:hypothetical protein
LEIFKPDTHGQKGGEYVARNSLPLDLSMMSCPVGILYFVTSPGYAELKDELDRFGLEYCNTG